MITIVENAWKIQNKIEKRLQKLKKRLPNSDTLYWRHNDFTMYLSGMVFFFGLGTVIMIVTYNPFISRCVNDWYILPFGIGEVFLLLFIICKKVDE